MRVRDIASVIEAFAPLELQESWDNSGLCIGSPEQYPQQNHHGRCKDEACLQRTKQQNTECNLRANGNHTGYSILMRSFHPAHTCSSYFLSQNLILRVNMIIRMKIMLNFLLYYRFSQYYCQLLMLVMKSCCHNAVFTRVGSLSFPYSVDRIPP